MLYHLSNLLEKMSRKGVLGKFICLKLSLSYPCMWLMVQLGFVVKYFYFKNWKAFLRRSMPLLRSLMIVSFLCDHIACDLIFLYGCFLLFFICLWCFEISPWCALKLIFFFSLPVQQICEYSNLETHLIPGKFSGIISLIIFFPELLLHLLD